MARVKFSHVLDNKLVFYFSHVFVIIKEKPYYKQNIY